MSALGKKENSMNANNFISASPILILNHKDYSDTAKIAQYKENVKKRYTGNWAEFFLDFEARTTHSLNQLKEQNFYLVKQNEELRENLKYMKDREKKREAEEILKNQAREKRRNAKKQSIREYVSNEEFSKIISSVDDIYKESFIKARVKVVLTLLFLTGLRISNLLLLKKRHLGDLLNKGECDIPLIKGGPSRNLLYIGAKGKKLLREFQSEINTLEKAQPNEDQFIFISKLEKNKPISSRNFGGQINRVLIEASKQLKKYIRSHSFRATFVTNLLEHGVTIERAKDIIGHKNISTTVTYRRSNIGVKDLRMVLRTVNRSRMQGLEIKKAIRNKCEI